MSKSLAPREKIYSRLFEFNMLADVVDRVSEKAGLGQLAP
jgi:hypothetical protein